MTAEALPRMNNLRMNNLNSNSSAKKRRKDSAVSTPYLRTGVSRPEDIASPPLGSPPLFYDMSQPGLSMRNLFSTKGCMQTQ